ncbi:hypothetical protein ACFL0Q_02785 [Thermodesulfobacteriota bacterium]
MLLSEDFPPGFTEYVQPLFDARQRTLQKMTSHEKLVCKSVLEAFPALGRGPTSHELVTGTALTEEQVMQSLLRLNSIDMLKYDERDARVLVLYPLSDIPCAHRVHIRGKRAVYAM